MKHWKITYRMIFPNRTVIQEAKVSAETIHRALELIEHRRLRSVRLGTDARVIVTGIELIEGEKK